MTPTSCLHRNKHYGAGNIVGAQLRTSRCAHAPKPQCNGSEYAPAPSRNVWILGFVSMLMDLSSEIYHALLPAFLTMVLGVPATVLGAIDGVAERTPISPNLHRAGSGPERQAKAVVVGGYGLAALSKPLCPAGG